MHNEILELFNNTYRPEAMEFFSAAKCNLNCTYCNITKNNAEIDKLHEVIIDDIKEGYSLIKKMKDFYGTDLSHMSLWGTEPTLTIKYMVDFFKKMLPEFPKLAYINFSSNFLAHTKDLIEFFTKFPVIDGRNIKINIQLSLDGPSWITDQNRRGGATEKIVKNMINFFRGVNESDISYYITTNFKPTIPRTIFPKLITDNYLLEYYQFFDDVMMQLDEANFNKKILSSYIADPTLVCPDNFTQQDGIDFNKMHEITEEIKKNNNFKYVKLGGGYYSSFARLNHYLFEYFTKQRMFTCSAGDSQFALSDYLGPCHDTFYLGNPKIRNSTITDHNNIWKDSQFNNIKMGRHEIANDNLVLDLSKNHSKKKIFTYFYRLRAVHDFTRLRISAGMAIIKELAYTGQISKCYKHDEMACLLSLYSNQRHYCPTSCQANLGSMMFNFTSYYKLFGNGLLENFLKRLLRETNK